MSATPPAGYGYFAITHSVSGATHFPTVTCGFLNTGFATAATLNTNLRAAMIASTNFWDAADMSAFYTMTSTYILLNTAGVLTTDLNVTPIIGTNVSLAPSPMNTAMIIRKNTAQAGRQFRGRMFMPPMNTSESNINQNGLLNGTAQSDLNIRSASFYAGLVANGLGPVLLHNPPLSGPTPSPTTIQSFTVTPLIGTIKRRIRT